MDSNIFCDWVLKEQMRAKHSASPFPSQLQHFDDLPPDVFMLADDDGQLACR